MRKSRALRVSSTRDICIFCATRQLVAVNALGASPNRSQRRYLNSSSKAPQYASEGLVYKEAEALAPKRMLTQAERMQQLLRARAPAPPPPPPTPPPNRMRVNNSIARDNARAAYPPQGPAPRSQFQQQRQPIPSRSQYQAQRQPGSERQPHRNSFYNPPAHSHAPNGQGLRNTRYNVNMDMQAGPNMETPAFGAGQLRRRNDPQMFGRPTSSSRTTEQPRPRPPRMDQAELDALLGNNSRLGPRETPRPRAPLSREANVRRTCMHCGSQVHGSLDCPEKPVLRQPQSDMSRQKGNLTDAAQAFAQRHGTELESEQDATATMEERRRNGTDNDRRPRRFQGDYDAPREPRNRYEDPKRRKPGEFNRRSRRVMRDEDGEEEDNYIGKAERKRLRQEAKKRAQEVRRPIPVYLPEYISVTNLATILKVRLEEFVAKLEELGFEEVQSDHILNAEHAGLVAQEYNFEPVLQSEEDDGDLRPAPALSPEEYANLPARPPVVTIMGHVDHGKTTILDYLRSASVAASEFGGITQHIGAFSVPLSSSKTITFLDTPGHAAFETMRARGANVTDIVVLVVAADDSVMPQTVEAIKHAQAAQVPMIVAINKIDKSQANPDAVKLDLGRHGIEVEDFGGDVQAVCVSGKTGQGIPDLEEAITTLSEMLDHRADPKANVEGWVLEGTTKKSGKVATVLVRSGTLRKGDILVAGNTWTRVRSLHNEAGATVEEVGPGMPVEVDGWREQPIAGDEVLQATDEQQAQAVCELRVERLEREQMAIDMDAINESRRQEAERREAEEAAVAALKEGVEPVEEASKAETGPELLSFIVKGDVSGSVEAVIDSISALGNGEVGTRVLRHGVGSPSEFDVEHAADAKGHIVNFNTPVSNNIKALAEKKGVKILDSNIIYRVVETVKGLLEEKLPPKILQRVTGEAEVAAMFEISLGGRKKMTIAGSKVRNGEIKKGARAKLMRKEEVVYDGVIGSLKNKKQDVLSMHKDTECGIAFEDGWSEYKIGDKIQCYEEDRIKRTL
ncbi:translation initiation factor-like protein IF-2 [Bimuria novae-zelandiae CBS 107.79]|uniref:Translation initiation factor IF-2, mitochondrial n=1 Tax=Bimuria novae-zelandiae CBS 107.79 TaxID=1447943 RepID=A0A6A5VQ48_9PLEO|nr:translation initiation factor-like protein IF-2 [Bimuria novae-zelandiae CBS 107.79]